MLICVQSQAIEVHIAYINGPVLNANQDTAYHRGLITNPVINFG